MLLPIGLDESRIARWPAVSIAVLALNVLVFAAGWLGGGEREVRRGFEAVARYWAEHPYLDLPPEMGRRFGLTREALLELRGNAPLPRAGLFAAEEQAHLDALCARMLDAHERRPERRFALVPARGLAQPGWLTYMFLHGGLAHLLGNMLVFMLVVAPFLEDVWGRPFFLAFYLFGGVVAGVCQALPMGDSQSAIVGASGGIAALLGAFTLRFAHRRVRFFYWFALVFRGTFFVPAWAYGFFGLGMDLLGLKLSGSQGGVAYGAHVGGFLFGLGATVALRATGLESRIAPEGAVPWHGSFGAARAADALAGGRPGEARAQLQRLLARDPDDEEALLALARLEARSPAGRELAPPLDRLLARRLGSGDAAGARAALEEFGGLDPALLRPATAYRAGELLEGSDPARASRFHEAAASAGGTLGAKALLRAAELARREPGRALALAERAAAAEGLPPELSARAERLVRELRPPPARPQASPRPAAEPRAPPGAATPARIVRCSLAAATESGLELVTPDGRRRTLPLSRLASVAVGLVDGSGGEGGSGRATVLADLLLRPRAGEAPVALRLAGSAIPLSGLYPGVPAREAFASLVQWILAASGAAAIPSPEAAAGRPFARYADVAAFEEASYGSPVSAWS